MKKDKKVFEIGAINAVLADVMTFELLKDVMERQNEIDIVNEKFVFNAVDTLKQQGINHYSPLGGRFIECDRVITC